MNKRIQLDKLRESVSAEVAALNPGLFTAVLVPDAKEFYSRDTKGDAEAEKDLQRLCEQELSRRGIWYLHLSPRSREKVGCPDILACVNGNAFACELKSATGRLSDEQKSTLELMASNGWKTHVCRSYQEFIEALNVATATER